MHFIQNFTWAAALISPACRTQLITGPREVAQARKFLECLKRHESELSPFCKSETALLSPKYRSTS